MTTATSTTANVGREVTDADLTAWLALAQAQLTDYMARTFPGQIETLDFERGKRYARIVKISGGGVSRSAFLFIDLTTGDILKSASWKTPAKGVRGNIFASNPLAGTTAYGAVYNR